MKILEFFGEPLSYGGQESFVYNVYKNINNDNIKFCFVTPFIADNSDFISLIKSKKDMLKSYDYDFISKNRKRYIIRTANLSITNEYDVVHIHSGSIFTLAVVAKIAKRKGVKKVIVHSHATGYDDFKHKIIKNLMRKTLENNADIYIACSKIAGEFKYSNSIINSNKFIIINNGIDIDKYRFNDLKRHEIRKLLNISDKKVLCNVGRFSEEKNQIFILRILHELLKDDQSYFLILIGGSGPEEININEYVKNCNLDNNVIILKNRKDVNDLLCASDIFLFPSKFEGLGISAIEAQTSGLYTIVSNNVPIETCASNNYKSLNINNGIDCWRDEIKKVITSNIDRYNAYKSVIANGFDIKDVAEKLEKIYIGDYDD